MHVLCGAFTCALRLSSLACNMTGARAVTRSAYVNTFIGVHRYPHARVESILDFHASDLPLTHCLTGDSGTQRHIWCKMSTFCTNVKVINQLEIKN